MNEIVTLDPKEYGLEESKAKQIADQFKPMLEKMQELESEFNEVVNMEMSEEKVNAAKELRLKYVKVRTGTAAIHKEQKAFYLAGGRFVDGWKNAQLFASQGIEEKLSDIESHYARIEAEKIETLRKERWSKLSNYLESEPIGLGVMQEDVFKHMLAGAKSAHEEKIKAEKKAEEERLEKERIEKIIAIREKAIAPVYSFFEVPAMQDLGQLSEKEFDAKLEDAIKAKVEHETEQEKQRKENERLKKEAEEREATIAQERKEREEREAKEAAIRAEKERKEREEQERIRKEAEEKLKAEREAREKAEEEIRLKKEAEEKARKKAELEAKKLAKLPVKKQLTNWVNALEMPTLNTNNFTSEDDQLATEIAAKFESFKKWALSQIENQ